MVDDTGLPGHGRLTVLEERDAFVVVREEDPGDWLTRFEKNQDFPARAWAENMVRVFNRRLNDPRARPTTPPGMQPATYHPADAE
jgi:hypothetical protein